MRLLLLTVLLGAWSSQAEEKPYSYESLEYGSISYNTFTVGKGLRFKKIKSFIEKNKITTLSNLLEELKKKEPELFDQYLLAYRSRSLQESSPLYPRVIIAADQAKFMMAFNGHSDHSGFNKLEIIEFDDSIRRFELREISFNNEGELPNFSQANPAKCLACHQSPRRKNIDPRPNWEPYDMWPGFYSSQGKLEDLETSLMNDLRLREEDKILMHEALNEKRDLERFEEEVKETHPLYKHLGPFRAKRTVEITDNLGFLNYQRVIRILGETPEFETYRPAFLSALKCSSFQWPEEVDEFHAHGSPYVETQRVQTFRPNLRARNLEILPYSSIEHKVYSFSIAQILTAIFEPIGVSTEDWSMDFRTERARFAFRERFGIPSRPRVMFETLVEKEWPGLYNLDCETLKEMARSQDYKVEAIGHDVLEEQLRSQVLNRCLSCHSQSNSTWSLAPELPFHRPAELLEAIKRRGYSPEEFYRKVEFNTGAHATLKDQMPPRQSLSAPERAALLKYLKEILH